MYSFTVESDSYCLVCELVGYSKCSFWVCFFRSTRFKKNVRVASIVSADREKINVESDKVGYNLDLIFIDEDNTFNYLLGFWEG